jgi:hypothetical protein
VVCRVEDLDNWRMANDGPVAAGGEGGAPRHRGI